MNNIEQNIQYLPGQQISRAPSRENKLFMEKSMRNGPRKSTTVDDYSTCCRSQQWWSHRNYYVVMLHINQYASNYKNSPGNGQLGRALCTLTPPSVAIYPPNSFNNIISASCCSFISCNPSIWRKNSKKKFMVNGLCNTEVTPTYLNLTVSSCPRSVIPKIGIYRNDKGEKTAGKENKE